MKTFHTRENDLEQNIPSDCWFEYSVCVKGGNRQNDGNSRRKTEKVEVELYEEQFGGERENDSLRIQKKDIATTGIQSARGGGAAELERVYLLKNARSFLASTVSRRVSLPAPVVTVSMVTV